MDGLLIELGKGRRIAALNIGRDGPRCGDQEKAEDAAQYGRTLMKSHEEP